MAMRWYISFPFSAFGVDAMGKKYPLHHAEGINAVTTDIKSRTLRSQSRPNFILR